jgi:hypothetical protein
MHVTVTRSDVIKELRMGMRIDTTPHFFVLYNKLGASPKAVYSKAGDSKRFWPLSRR